MSVPRALYAILALSLTLTACSDDGTTATAVADPAAFEELSFRFPEATREALFPTEVAEAAVSTAPAGVVSDDDEAPPPSDVDSKIISALTWVGFQSNYAFSSARQTYTGNHGEISTTATVTYDSKVIGTQPQSRVSTTPYLLDGGREKTLWIDAYVFTDQQCGLKVDGNSLHVASWQWFLGAVANWGEDRQTTQAFPPVEQEPCQEEIGSDATGSGSGFGDGGNDGGGLVTCWYLVTFDLATGEVLDAQFLYCDDALEGG